jgi:hypothetical protein
VQYLKNVLEQDHRAIIRRVKAKQGFREFQAAQRTIQGVRSNTHDREGASAMGERRRHRAAEWVRRSAFRSGGVTAARLGFEGSPILLDKDATHSNQRVVPLGSAQEIVISREEHVHFTLFCTRQVEGIKHAETERFKACGATCSDVAWNHDLIREDEQYGGVAAPLRIGVPVDLDVQHCAAHPQSLSVAYQPENSLNCFGLAANAHLTMIVGQTA